MFNFPSITLRPDKHNILLSCSLLIHIKTVGWECKSSTYQSIGLHVGLINLRQILAQLVEHLIWELKREYFDICCTVTFHSLETDIILILFVLNILPNMHLSNADIFCTAPTEAKSPLQEEMLVRVNRHLLN